MNLKDMEKPTKPVETQTADAIIAAWRSPFATACSTYREETSLVVDDETGLIVRTRVPIMKPLFTRGANGHLGAVED